MVSYISHDQVNVFYLEKKYSRIIFTIFLSFSPFGVHLLYGTCYWVIYGKTIWACHLKKKILLKISNFWQSKNTWRLTLKWGKYGFQAAIKDFVLLKYILHWIINHRLSKMGIKTEISTVLNRIITTYRADRFHLLCLHFFIVVSWRSFYRNQHCVLHIFKIIFQTLLEHWGIFLVCLLLLWLDF